MARVNTLNYDEESVTRRMKKFLTMFREHQISGKKINLSELIARSRIGSIPGRIIPDLRTVEVTDRFVKDFLEEVVRPHRREEKKASRIRKGLAEPVLDFPSEVAPSPAPAVVEDEGMIGRLTEARDWLNSHGYQCEVSLSKRIL